MADPFAEFTGYLTADEVQAAQSLHKRSPYSITGISQGFFSIARHYGGMDYNGCRYVYVPEHDECIRADVFKMVAKMRKPKNAAQPNSEQIDMLGAAHG